VKIIVLSHEKLADYIVECAEYFLGKTGDVVSIGLSLGDNPDDYEEMLTCMLAEIDEQVLFICDIKSGTPYNTACKLSFANSDIRVLYGMNLAMIIECLSNRNEMDVNELVHHIIKIMPKSFGTFEL